MKRVVWVGKVARAELAVPCPTCGAYIGVECATTIFREVPHTERSLRADVLGFRDVEDAPLFAYHENEKSSEVWPAHWPGSKK